MACKDLREIYEKEYKYVLDVSAMSDDEKAQWLLQNNTHEQSQASEPQRWRFRETGFMSFVNSLSNRLLQYAKYNKLCSLECVGMDINEDLSQCSECLVSLKNKEDDIDMNAYFSMTNVQNPDLLTTQNVEAAFRCMHCASNAYKSINADDIDSARQHILNSMIKCTQHNEADTRNSDIWFQDNVVTIIVVLMFTIMIIVVLYFQFKKT